MVKYLEAETKIPLMKPNAERQTKIEIIHEYDPMSFSAKVWIKIITEIQKIVSILSFKWLWILKCVSY